MYILLFAILLINCKCIIQDPYLLTNELNNCYGNYLLISYFQYIFICYEFSSNNSSEAIKYKYQIDIYVLIRSKSVFLYLFIQLLSYLTKAYV